MSRLGALFVAAWTCVALATSPALSQEAKPAETAEASGRAAPTLQELNKARARHFYEDLWFSDHTDRYARYLADEYVVHDIGERKDVVEPAIEQKRIADLFHANGEMTGSIDYQIAEGDLVATRWQWRFRPTSLRFRVMGGRNPVPIINVFRFRDGRIVEIWNHRHDIDTGLGNFAFVRGLAVGLATALLGGATVFAFRRRARRLAKAKA